MAKRAKGGMVNLNNDPDGTREGGKMSVVSGKKSVVALGKKTSSDGFAAGGTIAAKKEGGAVAKKEGGAISGASSAPSLAKRARGGRAPFSSANSMTQRTGASNDGHEGE
jgi:hypothetical protein